jgi:hypothetical protein
VFVPEAYTESHMNQFVMIHIYMEMSQGNFMCRHLKQTKYVIFFLSFTKSENVKAERSCMVVEVGTSGRGEQMGKAVLG